MYTPLYIYIVIIFIHCTIYIYNVGSSTYSPIYVNIVILIYLYRCTLYKELIRCINSYILLYIVRIGNSLYSCTLYNTYTLYTVYTMYSVYTPYNIYIYCTLFIQCTTDIYNVQRSYTMYK